jgi:type IV pilus assembly protein PilN
MIRINLLPYHEKAQKANLARQLIVIAAALGLFLFIIALIQIYMVKSISDLEADIKQQKARLAVLTKIIGDIDQAKQDKQLLEMKLNAINGLEENRLYPIRLLDEISSLVPTKNIWLEKIDQTGNSMKIDGIGRDNIAVSLFMKTIESSKFIRSVEIISSKQVEIAGNKLQEFTFACVLRKGQ